MWINQKGMANEYLDGLPYVRWAQTVYSPSQAPVTFRLGDYGIDVRADEKGVYLPIATLADLYSDLAYHHAFYSGEKVYVQNENVDGKLEDRDPDYLNAFSEMSVRPADLAEFTYNELCFAIDHFYGCPGRELLHTELQEKGLDRALRGYGDMGTETIALLRSTDPAEYLIGNAPADPGRRNCLRTADLPARRRAHGPVHRQELLDVPAGGSTAEV